MTKLLSITTLHLFNPKANRYFLADITFLRDGKRKPIIIFVHGFKGFKDWGPFNAMAEYFANQGFVFLKFNFSRNGTTPEHPIDFVDLEAFGHDNVSTQLFDLGIVLDWINNETNPVYIQELDNQQIYLIGHSRGGSLVLLKAAEDHRVKKVVTWAAVSNLLASYSIQDIEKWKSDGVLWIPNARTKQQMPVYYQYYEDLITNDGCLNVLESSGNIQKPLLILHGEKDETVSLSNALDIQKQVINSQLVIIKGANHTFGGVHPFLSDTFPETLMELFDKTFHFLKSDHQ